MKTILNMSAVLSLGMGLAICAGSTQAVTLKTSGTWTSVTPTTGVSGVGTRRISWGKTVFPQVKKSGYRFAGRGPKNIGLNVLTSGPILLGKFTHFNYPVKSPFLETATLGLNVQLGKTQKTFSFGFKHFETPNFPGAGNPCAAGGGTPCQDKVYFENAMSPKTFKLAGMNYQLKLSGFATQKGGPIIDSLLSKENRANKAFLYGHLAKAESVPEPTTIMATITAAGAAGMMSRKRKRAAKKTA